jgi:CheY-like chemotaxis protein
MTAAKRSADLTGRLLAFARKQTIAPRLLDLNDTVAGMLKMLRRIIGEDIDLVWESGAGLWPVMMDPSQIDQILVNLCVNARDAIGGVGKVVIETENKSMDETYGADHPDFVPGDYVMLAVSDDGCGMDKETLNNLFEPFFTTKKVGEGTGLGLATVYGIVKQNNGFINIYSEPGKGSTFRVYLPRHAGAIEAAEFGPKLETPLGRGETVLVVEDESAILNMAQKMLTGLGYRVLTAPDPASALKLAAERGIVIHLLMTDVVMPEMNGLELARRLKTRHPDLKILFMSGHTANVIAHRGILNAGVHFIQKPFSRKDLAGKVREALSE